MPDSNSNAPIWVNAEMMIHDLPKEEGMLVSAIDTRATFQCVPLKDGSGLTWKQINTRLCVEDFPAEKDIVTELLLEQHQEEEFAKLPAHLQKLWNRADRRQVS